MSVPSVLGLRQKKGVWFWLGGRARSPSPYGGPFAAPEAARGPPCSMRGVSPRHSPQTLLGVMASFALWSVNALCRSLRHHPQRSKSGVLPPSAARRFLSANADEHRRFLHIIR